MINSQIAQRIKMECKRKNISINQLTKDCGLGKSLIYDMEIKNSSPSIEKIMTISEYLNCSINYLLGITEISENNSIQNNGNTVISGTQANVIKGSNTQSLTLSQKDVPEKTNETNDLKEKKIGDLDGITFEAIKMLIDMKLNDKLKVISLIDELKNQKGNKNENK